MMPSNVQTDAISGTTTIMNNTLYTHDLLGNCWSCTALTPWEELKDVCLDVAGEVVSLCPECYEALENMEGP